MEILLILGGVAVVLAMVLGGYYNSFVRLRNLMQSAWSDIDTHLKKRYDLIPNIVETVKGYATHEKDTLEKVIQARGQAMGASNPKEQMQAENFLTGALKSLFALSENYPELKADKGFQKLQDTLSNVENDLNMARRYYNGSVKNYNNRVQMFPANLFASLFGFADADFFEADDDERENVKVAF